MEPPPAIKKTWEKRVFLVIGTTFGQNRVQFWGPEIGPKKRDREYIICIGFVAPGGTIFRPTFWFRFRTQTKLFYTPESLHF